MKSCNAQRSRRVANFKHLLRASAPGGAHGRPDTTSPSGSLKRFGSISPMGKTIDGLGSPVSPLISATTRLFTRIRFLPLPPTTMPKKVIHIKTANIVYLYDLEKLTILRITSQTAIWGRPERPGSHTIDTKHESKAEVMATFSGKKLEVSFQTC